MPEPTQEQKDYKRALDLLYEAKRTLAAQDEDTAYPGSRRDYPIEGTIERIGAFLEVAMPRWREHEFLQRDFWSDEQRKMRADIDASLMVESDGGGL